MVSLPPRARRRVTTMKRCPSCGRLFEDVSHLCTEDGTALVGMRVMVGQPAETIVTRSDRPTADLGEMRTMPRGERRLNPQILFAGKYALLRTLGEGGMGSVFEGENAWTGRRVAIKVLRPDLLSSPDIVARFVQEGRATSRVVHPNIVQILDMGQEQATGALYIVQEFLVGIDLKTRLERGRLTLREALDVLLPVMGALAMAHARGIVHRDVKPGNIVETRDAAGASVVPKLIDFGIAKILSTPSGERPIPVTHTFSGSLVGTPAYMSPEQITGDRTIDGQADVWSLGAVLYEALSGERAFRAGAFSDLARRILTERPIPLAAVAPGVPKEIGEVVHRALEPDRSQRHASMRAMIDALLATPALSEDATGVQLVRRHRVSLPVALPEARSASDWRIAVRFEDWRRVEQWVALVLAKRGLPVEDLPAGATSVEILAELPEGRRLELSGRAETSASGAHVRIDPSHEVDLLLLQQVAGAHAAPMFLAAKDAAAPIEKDEPARNRRPTGAIAPALGIDFGTTYTSAAAVIEDRAYLITDDQGRGLWPSIVSYSDRGAPLVGWEARRALLSIPGRTAVGVKRLLGRRFSDPLLAGYLGSLPYRCSRAPNDSVLIEIDDPPATPIQIAALSMEHARRTAEQQLGVTFERAVLTVPVAFTKEQRSALERAAQRAGLEVLALIDEPIAASLACGFGAEREEVAAVYDLGGGTFDFSIVEVSSSGHRVIAAAGDAWLGGDDFDMALAQGVADALWRATRIDVRRRVVEWQKLLFACEQAKRALSFEESALVLVEGVVETPNRIDIRETVTRARFEEMGRPLLERTVDIVRSALDGSHFSPARVDRVVVTGGMARAPFIRREVERIFEREIAPVVNPEEAVCLGAAIVAARRAGHPVKGVAR
jgi:serine/threonine protein kinase/actin-like ATPase involved in cell morphogenesis